VVPLGSFTSHERDLDVATSGKTSKALRRRRNSLSQEPVTIVEDAVYVEPNGFEVVRSDDSGGEIALPSWLRPVDGAEKASRPDNEGGPRSERPRPALVLGRSNTAAVAACGAFT
jgi:hypothetical protein